MRGLLFFALLACLASPRPGVAQGLQFDGLTFGESGAQDVEATYGGRLRCTQAARGVEQCAVVGSVRRVEVALADGRLRGLRMLLPAPALAEEVAADLRRRWGATTNEGVGTGRAEGLRFWVYALPEGGMAVLAEVRSRISGQHRLRLTIVDPRTGWTER